MAHGNQRNFIQETKYKYPQYFTNVNVLEVGSLNINGTVRDFFMEKSYLGIDLIEGNCVDKICKGHEMDSADGTYDTIISTECFEHDIHWKETFKNMHRMVRSGGMIVFTCASDGRPEHGTTRTSPQDSPATNDYYQNLNEGHFISEFNLKSMFSQYSFEYNGFTADLYFWGIKR